MELVQIYSVSSGRAKNDKLLILKKRLTQANVKDYGEPYQG